jgi:hypothetical protein
MSSGRRKKTETQKRNNQSLIDIISSISEFNVIVNPVFMSETSASRSWRHFSGPVKWMLPINDEQGILIA